MCPSLGPGPEELDELGITLRGHRKRILLRAPLLGAQAGGAADPADGRSDEPSTEVPPPRPPPLAGGHGGPLRPRDSVHHTSEEHNPFGAELVRHRAASMGLPDRDFGDGAAAVDGSAPKPRAVSLSQGRHATTFTAGADDPGPLPPLMSSADGSGGAGGAGGDATAAGRSGSLLSSLDRLVAVTEGRVEGGFPVQSIPVEDGGTGTVRLVSALPGTTVANAIAECVLYGLGGDDPDAQHQLFEVIAVPGMMHIERALAPEERLLQAMESWPQLKLEPPGTKFVLKPVDATQSGLSHSGHTGQLDKRGGSKGHTRNWKSRYFILHNGNLLYYKSPPKNEKQHSNPLGIWPVDVSFVYNVVHMRKVKTPELCFCLKPQTVPLWPSDASKLVDAFEATCKFMCARCVRPLPLPRAHAPPCRFASAAAPCAPRMRRNPCSLD